MAFFIEVAKAKRTCSKCNEPIPKGKACLVFGNKQERLSRRNLCQGCLAEFHGRMALHNSGVWLIFEEQE